ncbi:MAG: S41 family peptidase [Fulvivirga sp.]
MKVKAFYCSVILLLVTIGCESPAQKLSPEEYEEDIEYLKLNLEKYHAGLYLHQSKEEFNTISNRIASNYINGSYVELVQNITALTAAVKCGHTRMRMPPAISDSIFSTFRYLPFNVKYLSDRLFIAKSLIDGINRGDEILSINGKTISEINNLIFPHVASDGNNLTGKFRSTEVLFRYRYPLYVEPTVTHYQVLLIDGNGDELKKEFPGFTMEEVTALFESNSNEPELSLNNHGAYSILRISTFGSSELNSAGYDYYDFLDEAFKKIQSQNVENLILDLRDNGGGDDNYGAKLVSYLMNKDFNYFESITVTEDYSGYGRIANRDGKRLMTSHKGLSTWKPDKNAFIGNLYILINGNSFSTCADVVSVLHHNGRGLLIGEETGGGYNGNTSGSTDRITLPNSKIEVAIPMWCYKTANGYDTFQHHGAMPHKKVIPSRKQFIEGIDAELSVAQELINNN